MPLNQFNNIINNSVEGEYDSLKQNNEYNKQRIVELQKQIELKNKELEMIPQIVSRQFDELMQLYANASQKEKNKAAEDLHQRWQMREKEIQTELKMLNEQLSLAQTREIDSNQEMAQIRIKSAIEKYQT